MSSAAVSATFSIAFSQSAFSQTVVPVGPITGNTTPIIQVTLDDNGTQVIQTTPGGPGGNIQRATPVFLEDIVIDTTGDGLGDTTLDIFNFEGAEVTLQNLATNVIDGIGIVDNTGICLLYTSPSPRDQRGSRMPSSA